MSQTNQREEVKIHGIPASRWYGRFVGFYDKENKQHPMPAMVKGVAGRHILVKPNGHKRLERILPENITPCWGRGNDDLRQEFGINGKEDTSPVVEEATINEEPIMHTNESKAPQPPTAPLSTTDSTAPINAPEAPPAPPVEIKPAAEEYIPSVNPPKMVIHRHSNEWMEPYKEYVRLLESEQSDLRMQAELEKSLRDIRGQQMDKLMELAALGVEILVGDNPSSRKTVAPAAARKKPSSRLGCRPPNRLINSLEEAKLKEWMVFLRERNLGGGKGYVGRKSDASREAGVGYHFFIHHHEKLAKACGVLCEAVRKPKSKKVSYIRLTAEPPVVEG